MPTTEVIYREGTMRIWAYFQDEAGTAYVSPDAGVKITVWDKDGTKKVDAVAMTEDETGKFYYDYTPASDAVQGSWTYFYKGTDGAGANAKGGTGWGAFEEK